MTEMDNGMFDVTVVEADGTDEGLVLKLDTIAPEYDCAIWVSNDGSGGLEGCSFVFLSNPLESIDMSDK